MEETDDRVLVREWKETHGAEEVGDRSAGRRSDVAPDIKKGIPFSHSCIYFLLLVLPHYLVVVVRTCKQSDARHEEECVGGTAGVSVRLSIDDESPPSDCLVSCCM